MLMNDEGWQQENEESNVQSHGGVPLQPLESVKWTASEYIASQKSSQWYVLFGIGAALLTLIVYWVTQSVASSLVVVMVCVVIGIFAARKPQTLPYELSEDGIHIGTKFFSYHIFKSFAVVDEEAISCIWLRPLKRFMPTVNMYFAPDDEDKIIKMLDNFLPEEDRTHDVVDRISRRFKF